MIESLPPGLILVLGALGVPLLRGHPRRALLLLLPVLGLCQLWLLPEGLVRSLEVFGYPLQVVRVDALSKVFGYVFYIAALLNALYALHVEDPLQHAVFGPAIHAGVDRVPVAESRRQPAPLASMLGHVQNRVKRLKIGNTDVAALPWEA